MSERSQDSFRIGQVMGKVVVAKALLDEIRRPIKSEEVPTRPLYKVSHSLNNRLQFCMHDLDCIMRDLKELNEYRREETERRRQERKKSKLLQILRDNPPIEITYHEESSE